MARVLVVDDDAATREVVREILEQSGHEVADADGGRAALATVRERTFDLVVIDIIMPDIDGIETIGELKGLAPDTKIVAMSGSSPNSAGYLQTAQLLGADAALEKPFGKKALQATVDSVLSGQQRPASGPKLHA